MKKDCLPFYVKMKSSETIKNNMFVTSIIHHGYDLGGVNQGKNPILGIYLLSL